MLHLAGLKVVGSGVHLGLFIVTSDQLQEWRIQSAFDSAFLIILVCTPLSIRATSNVNVGDLG